MIEEFKSRARALRSETYILYFAARDPRTPWVAKLIVLFTVAYALSPIDLIPDFVPVLGYLDDLIIIPAGIALAIRLIPPEVLDDARSTVATQGVGRGVGMVGATFIIVIWVAVILWLIHIFIKLSKS